ncbi:MAG TPA: AMP-binding protein [Acidimicrobiales bacterium]|nr:AMP-binding protein [Acidimicrobiales bacterium]
MSTDALDPFTGRNVGWLLAQRAQAHPERECVVWDDLDGDVRRWTYRQLVDRVDAVAAGFAAHGVGPGDRVCVHMDNSPDFVFTWLGLLTLGAVAVTTNTRSSPEEVDYFLDRSRAVAVATEVGREGIVARALSAPRVRLLVLGGGGDLPPVDVPDRVRVTSVDDLATATRGTTEGPRSSDLAGVQFTSGTTSRPKGVVWTQANYLWGAKVSAAHQLMTGDDRTLTYLPLFHTNAQVYSVMATLWAGGTVVLMPRFSRRAFWAVAVRERTTFAAMIPFAVRALVDDPVPGHHFRAWGNGLLVPRWDRTFGVEGLAWWGMTETVSHPVVSELGQPGRPLAMGVPAPEYRVRVVDDEGLPRREAGEGLIEVLGVRGVSVALGYLDDPDADAAAWTDDGWLRTGDRVVWHEDGWLSFLERDKDMLRVGAENVAAQEIERVVLTVEGVAEVAVVAGPDPMLDEVPVAFVLATQTAEPGLEARVLERCRAELADFKVPRAVFVVDELPRSTLEKVAKNKLRDEARRLMATPAGHTAKR